MKILYLFLVCVAASWLVPGGQAAIEFVQLTDPHIFDGKRAKDEPQNRDALRACITNINALHQKGTNRFRFIALTGDIGLDSLTDATLFSNGLTTCESILTNCLVTTWLFVPGNNDLEKEYPTKITRYHEFVQQLGNRLAPGMIIIDLCPRGSSTNESTSRSFVATNAGQTYHFIGFDNASFKNENNADQARRFRDHQLANITNLNAALREVPATNFAYILFHIPDVDDPHAVFNNPPNWRDLRLQKSLLGDDVPYSAWTVHPEVRTAWDKIVRTKVVKGLIAGHFHASHRDAYRHFDWLKGQGYASANSGKLFVAPPVACKFQVDTPTSARGFSIFYVTTNSGKITNNIVWYEPPSPPHFDADTGTRSSGGGPPASPVILVEPRCPENGGKETTLIITVGTLAACTIALAAMLAFLLIRRNWYRVVCLNDSEQKKCG